MLLRCPTSTEDLITACGVFDVPWSWCLGAHFWARNRSKGLIALHWIYQFDVHIIYINNIYVYIYVYNIYIVQLYNIVWSSWSRHSILISCKFIFWFSAVLFLVVLQCSLTILKDSSNKSSWGMSGYSIYNVNLRLESNLYSLFNLKRIVSIGCKKHFQGSLDLTDWI